MIIRYSALNEDISGCYFSLSGVQTPSKTELTFQVLDQKIYNAPSTKE